MIGLQASRADGQGVTSSEFLDPLSIHEGEATRAEGGAWRSGMVYLGVVRYSDFDHVDQTEDAGAQNEAFFAGIIEAFQTAGRFLDLRAPSVTAAMRSNGLKLQLFIDVRMDQDQMELEFPPELLAACGRHKLPIFLMSNDIPAHEILAARNL